MNYKLINEKLKDIKALRRTKCFEKSSKPEYDSSEHYEIYALDDSLYVKIVFYSDSYGDEETVVGLTLVQPQEVKITNFIDVE